MVGPIFVILTFSIDRIIAYKIRKKESQRSWYIKVLIDPHLKEIEAFFVELPEIYKASVKELKSRKKYISESDYLSLQAKFNGQFQEKKRQINLDFIAVFSITNPKMAENLRSIFNNIEDQYVKGLDDLDDDFDTFNNKIVEFKAKVIYILSKPLE